MDTKALAVTFSTTPPSVFVDGSSIPEDAEILYEFTYKLSDNANSVILPQSVEPSVVRDTILQKTEARTLSSSVKYIVNGVESEASEESSVEIPALPVPETPPAPTIDVQFT